MLTKHLNLERILLTIVQGLLIFCCGRAWVKIMTFMLNKWQIISQPLMIFLRHTVYPKKYAHGFVVLCFVVVMQSFIMNSHEVFIHIHQGCFAGTGAIVRLPQCQWSKPDGYGKISQCIATTKHSKAKTVCIFLGIYCICMLSLEKEASNWYLQCQNQKWNSNGFQSCSKNMFK